MALNDPDRDFTARAWIQKVFVEMNGVAAMAHPDIKAAVDATDAWIDANQASFNAALPNPFRSTATLEEKTLLFSYVAYKRAGLS